MQIQISNIQIQNIKCQSNKKMHVEDTKRIFKVIQTTKGDILSPFSNIETKVKVIIFNQILNPECSRISCNLPLDLQHLNAHRHDQYTLQNTSITWASIEHQIRQVLTQTGSTQNDILLFDSSEYTKKIPQIFNRFNIVKGYNYRINLQSLNNKKQQKLTLMSQQHVLKQIQMQFSLGNGVFKPGYIGQIMFFQLQNQIFQGIIKAYISYSSITKCPIVLNFIDRGDEPYGFNFSNSFSELIQRFHQKLDILEKLLSFAKQQNASQNLIIYNLPFLISLQKESLKTQNVFSQRIQTLINKYQVTIGFSLLRYSKNGEKQGINEIIKLIHKFPMKIILSSGLKYKTDLILNAGQGLSLYSQSSKSLQSNSDINKMTSIQYIKHFINQNQLDEVLRSNILRLFDWKQKKEQIKIQIFWKCDCCKKDFSQSIKAFGKFGKQFCSIPCLKSYKF